MKNTFTGILVLLVLVFTSCSSSYIFNGQSEFNRHRLSYQKVDIQDGAKVEKDNSTQTAAQNQKVQKEELEAKADDFKMESTQPLNEVIQEKKVLVVLEEKADIINSEPEVVLDPVKEETTENLRDDPDPDYINYLAWLSLASAIIGLLFIPLLGSIAGLVLGVMGLMQSRYHNGKGRTVAIIGIVISVLGLALIGALIYILIMW